MKGRARKKKITGSESLIGVLEFISRRSKEGKVQTREEPTELIGCHWLGILSSVLVKEILDRA